MSMAGRCVSTIGSRAQGGVLRLSATVPLRLTCRHAYWTPALLRFCFF
jgi:hypothetical protein